MADVTLQISTALSTIKLASPLGDLGVLPREIRDQIYYNLVTSTNFKAYYSDTIVNPSAKYEKFFGKRYGKQHCIVAIIRASKAIKDEIIPVLFSKGTFYFEDHVYFRSLACFKTPYTDITNRMMNIEICLDLWTHLGNYRDGERILVKRSLRFGPFHLFTGTHILRRTLHIHFINLDPGDIAEGSLRSPIFKAIKGFSGFRTVIFEVGASAGNAYCSLTLPRASRQMREAKKAKDWLKLYDGLEITLLDMKRFYESSLGPSSGVSELTAPYQSLDDAACRHIVFHPHDYLNRISKRSKDVAKATADEKSIAE